MRTGIYGGTFDPVHYGHLLLAETARESLSLDRVFFVPAGIPPHKRSRTITPGDLRAEMLLRAIDKVPEFEVCRFEIDSPEVSYTVETLRYFHALYPDDELFLIVGSETLADMPNWWRPEEIFRLASPISALRPGTLSCDAAFSDLSAFASEEQIERYRRQVISMPLLEISSTDIRRRVQEGRSVRFLTPDAVIETIHQFRLYR